MTLVATSQVSLLKGLTSSKSQPAISPLMAGGTSTFAEALDNTAIVLASQPDFDGLVPNTKLALETAVLESDGASMTPSNPIEDASKENPAAPVADALWLANWFQKNAPAAAFSPIHSPASSFGGKKSANDLPTVSSHLSSTEVLSKVSLDMGESVKLSQSVGFKDDTKFENGRCLPLMPGSGPDAQWTLNLAQAALKETTPKPLTVLSSNLISTTDVTISDQSKPSTRILSDKSVNVVAQPPVAVSSNVSASFSLPISPPVQASSPLAYPSTSKAMGIGGNKASNDLSNASGHLSSTEVLSRGPLDMGASVKLSQSDGFKEVKDFENGRWLPLMSGAVQVRSSPQMGQKLEHQVVGTEAVLPDSGPEAQWTLNLAEPALMETAPKSVLASDPISRTEVPISDQSQHIPRGLPDKPLINSATAPAATPSNLAVSSMLPTATAIQATSQPVSIEVVILDKKSPKNQSLGNDHLRATEVFSKVPTDIGSSVSWGQSVGAKGFNDFENDRFLPVMPGSEQVSWEPLAGQTFTQQSVGTEAVPSGLSPESQWTSNLADTVNQWVERSLLLAELTVPDAGQESLEVRIELNGQEATVYFLTDHDQYRHAIESQIENLSDRLADQGLKLAGSFVGQGSSQNSSQQQSAHTMLSRRPERDRAPAKVMAMDPVLRDSKSVHQGQVLDVFA